MSDELYKVKKNQELEISNLSDQEKLESKKLQAEKNDQNLLEVSKEENTDLSLDGFVALNAEKIEKPEIASFAEPKYIGFDEKYTVIKKNDSERMKAVKRALSRCYKVTDKGAEYRQALSDLLEACDDYTFMRFSIFRGQYGKMRLKEVERLRNKVRAMQLELDAKELLGDDAGITQQILWKLDMDDYNTLANEIRRGLRNKNLSDKEREEIRKKVTYKIEKLGAKQQDNNKRYILGSQNIKSIRDAIKDVMPEAYGNMDKYLTDEEAEKAEVELVHSEGSKFLNMGHDVIEFDVAGSGFDQARREHSGYHGITTDDENTIGNLYDNKMNKDGYLWSTKKEQLVNVDGKERLCTKTRYSIAGPASLNLNGISDYSIQATRKRIRDMGAEHLKPIFDKWKEELATGKEPDYHVTDIMLRGHSRGGVGASHGAMMLKYWVQENYPEFLKYVKFNLIQYDPVPGGDVEFGLKDGIERFDHKSYQGVNQGSFEIDGEKMAPLEESSGTTVVYSMVNQADWTHETLFSPQEVLHAKRLILMPFTHDIGLDLTHIDTSQMKNDSKEKAHGMAFFDAKSNKVYRNSGLNELDDGVYVMDENHVMVKVDTFAQLKNILMRTMPDTYAERRERILRAAASVFGDHSAMNDYAAIDHARINNLKEDILAEGNASSYRKNVKDSLERLTRLLAAKKEFINKDDVIGSYEDAIQACETYISKRDDGKYTTNGRRRLEQIKLMHEALIREMRHFEQAFRENADMDSLASYEQIFGRKAKIDRTDTDVSAANDPTMGEVLRLEKSGKVSFFKEMDEKSATGAYAMSIMTERMGEDRIYRPAQTAVILARDEQQEKNGIVYEQTYDLSYTQVMARDSVYAKKAKPEMTKRAKKKLDKILAFDLLFGIKDRILGDYSSIRVQIQRHADENTKEIAAGGNLSDIMDTYSITDVCGDVLVSEYVQEGFSNEVTSFDKEALTKLSKNAKNILKSLKPADISHLTDGALTPQVQQALSRRLKALQGLL